MTDMRVLNNQYRRSYQMVEILGEPKLFFDAIVQPCFSAINLSIHDSKHGFDNVPTNVQNLPICKHDKVPHLSEYKIVSTGRFFE